MMFYPLKHTLILLSAGVMLSACSAGDDPVESGCEMKFSVSTASRAQATTAANITEQSIAVFGDRTPSDIPESNPVAVFNNTEIKYDGQKNIWTTDVPQYWWPNHEHTFVAVHPAYVLSYAFNPYHNSEYSDSELSFVYSLPQIIPVGQTFSNEWMLDYERTVDILAATHRRLYIDKRYDENGIPTGQQANPVSLEFRHMLTQINIAPALYDNHMKEDEYIQFHKMELSGFSTEAVFAITPDKRQTAEETNDIIVNVTDHDGSGCVVIEFPESERKKITNNGKNVSLLVPGDDDYADPIIMLPQSFADDSEVKINLWYTINNDNSLKHIALPLSGQKWEWGKSYTYRFTIGSTGWHFDTPSIKPWTTINHNMDVE